jgi:hypothetical protein
LLGLPRMAPVLPRLLLLSLELRRHRSQGQTASQYRGSFKVEIVCTPARKSSGSKAGGAANTSSSAAAASAASWRATSLAFASPSSSAAGIASFFSSSLSLPLLLLPHPMHIGAAPASASKTEASTPASTSPSSCWRNAKVGCHSGCRQDVR